MFKTIIWATDGSRAAEQALPYAKGLAMAGRARLIVVHVDEFSVGKGGGYSIYVDEPENRSRDPKASRGVKAGRSGRIPPDIEGTDGRRRACDR